MFAQVEPQAWMQYGAFGVIGLLVTVGIPWLLKHIREMNDRHAATIEKTNEEHTERVNKIVQDHQVERNVHILNMERVCATFTSEMKEERAACERRTEQLIKARI
jgi:predicted transcriptional regulator